jgi:hypothetical protein
LRKIFEIDHENPGLKKMTPFQNPGDAPVTVVISD